MNAVNPCCHITTTVLTFQTLIKPQNQWYPTSVYRRVLLEDRSSCVVLFGLNGIGCPDSINYVLRLKRKPSNLSVEDRVRISGLYTGGIKVMELTIREHLRGLRSYRCRRSLRSWTRYRWGIRTRGLLRTPGRCSIYGSLRGGRDGWRSRRWKPHRGRGSRNRSLLLGNTERGHVRGGWRRRNRNADQT